MRSKVFFKLLLAFFVVIATATLILDFSIRHAWENSLRAEVRQSLTEKARMFAFRINSDKNAAISQIVTEEAQASGARATAIDSSGRVVADSEANPLQMENHAQRPEFAAALAGNTGVDSRISKTVGTEFLYVAVPANGGAVRLAYPVSNIHRSAQQLRTRLLSASGMALLVAILISTLIAHSISRRLNNIVEFADKVAHGDLSARISENSSDEIAQVAAALDATGRRLEESFADLQLSKKQLETLLDSIPNAVVAVSADRVLRWANGAMHALDPNVRAGSPIVESFRDPEVLKALTAAIEQSTVRSVHTTRLVSGRALNVTAAPMPGGGAVAVLQDVTEIERVEKTRRDFIANVSHELRTPLTSIQGYAETVLESYPDSAQGKQFLEIIQKNAARMTRLTEDLLVLARVESGEDKLRLEPVSTGTLLQEANNNFEAIAKARGITLSVQASAEQTVLADRDAIQQVFANLLENAVKYSPSGSNVVLGAEANGTKVRFFVRDSGAGISSEHQPRLFERFYRVDASRSRESGGTGLGLAIVKHIVLNHGGAVWVESELNHGATFYFTLPFSQDHTS